MVISLLIRQHLNIGFILKVYSTIIIHWHMIDFLIYIYIYLYCLNLLLSRAPGCCLENESCDYTICLMWFKRFVELSCQAHFLSFFTPDNFVPSWTGIWVHRDIFAKGYRQAAANHLFGIICDWWITIGINISPGRPCCHWLHWRFSAWNHLVQLKAAVPFLSVTVPSQCLHVY